MTEIYGAKHTNYTGDPNSKQTSLLLSDKALKESGPERVFEKLLDESIAQPYTTHTGFIYNKVPELIVRTQPFELVVDYDSLYSALEKCGGKSAIFAVNHSNSHDGPNIHRTLSKMGLTVSLLVATDALSQPLSYVFNGANSVGINRDSKESAYASAKEIIHRLYDGQYPIIFPETTWNLHPIKPMQGVKRGTVYMAATAGRCVIPTIMEYIEIPELFSKEKRIYKKCVIKFGDPLQIDQNESINMQSLELEKRMAQMRREIWIAEKVNRESLENINPEIYTNHTALKIY